MLNIWGKTSNYLFDQNGFPVKKPLVFHMIDTGNVMRYVLQEVVKGQCQQYCQSNLGEKYEDLMCFWASMHDIGKSHKDWQSQAKKILHGQVTAQIMYQLLDGYSRNLAQIIGSHHGFLCKIEDIKFPVKSEDISSYSEIESAMLKLFNYPPISKEISPSFSFMVFFWGLLSVSDWIASNEQFFPIEKEISFKTLEEYFQFSKEKTKKAIDGINLSQWLPPLKEISFKKLFGFKDLNPLQEVVENMSNNFNEPEIVIIEAPMGDGKTEAAIYLADRWISKNQQKGIYFALPTQATSNQMFGRMKEYLDSRYPDDVINYMLLHGNASLFPDFKKIRHSQFAIQANSWFSYSKRGLLAQFGLGTVDQCLMAVLNVKHFGISLYALSNKTVVIDEVHAYDTYMQEMLERLMEWFGSLRCSVVLLSATLPRSITLKLICAYNRGKGHKVSETINMAKYPRITWTQDGDIKSQHIGTDRKITLNIRFVNGTEGKSKYLHYLEDLSERIEKEGCVAIICSTVRRAQDTYDTIKKYFDGSDMGITLYHSRYLHKDRQAIEKRVLQMFGKPNGKITMDDGEEISVERPRKHILVATQVIEQSLDLDFDLMITDMAPIDAILQRSGRIHRHKRERYFRLTNPEMWICKPDNNDSDNKGGEDGGVKLDEFDEATQIVYGCQEKGYLLYKSWEALQKRNKDQGGKDAIVIKIPDDVELLMDEVYEKNGKDLVGEMAERHKSFQEGIKKHCSAARKNMIPSPTKEILDLEEKYPVRENDFENKCHAEEDCEEISKATRLAAIPTIRCVFLYGSDKSKCSATPDGKPLDLNCKIGSDDYRQIMENSVLINQKSLYVKLLEGDNYKPSEWTNHAVLKYCRLVLVSPESNGCVKIGNMPVSVDNQYGVRVMPNKN